LDRRLIDTGVFVDYLRGYAPAIDWLDGLEEPGLVSVVTYAELLAGAGSSKIEQKIEGLLQSRRAIRIDTAIARRAGALIRLYGPSHNVAVPGPSSPPVLRPKARPSPPATSSTSLC
jgi:predicted nucleic acid-binding protein